MATSNFTRGSNAIIFGALTVGAVCLINLISSRQFTRFDLTEDKIYSLSEASKKLVHNLPDRLTVKAFISGDLPEHEQLKAIERYLRDTLDEFAASSDGKMTWEALDPSKDDKIKDEARRLKVMPRSLGVYKKNQSAVAQAYMGVAFQYAGNVESIPFVVSLNDLEYQVASTIKRLTVKRKKIGFTSGHGEPTTQRGIAGISRRLRDYETTTVDLTGGKKPIPDDVDILMVIGPNKRFAPRAQYEIDQFLMKGKSVAFAIDGMVLETPRGRFGKQAPPRIGRANNVGLRQQLEYYGAKLNEDMIMDRQNQRVQLPAAQGQVVVTNYPGFPVVTTLDKESPITRKLRVFVSVFPASVELTKWALDKKNITSTVLASSSAASWRHKGFFLFDPLHPPKPTKELGPYPLAVSLRGKIRSFFDGKPVPPPGEAKGPKDKATKPKGTKFSPDSARVVVIGDSDLFRDQFLGLSQGHNVNLFLNTADYLAADESLIAIRSKAQTRRPLENLEEGTTLMAKVANIVGVPLLFILLGVGRWRWHRARRKREAARVAKL